MSLSRGDSNLNQEHDSNDRFRPFRRLSDIQRAKKLADDGGEESLSRPLSSLTSIPEHDADFC